MAAPPLPWYGRPGYERGAIVSRTTLIVGTRISFYLFVGVQFFVNLLMNPNSEL
jgi:hypothetical protein